LRVGEQAELGRGRVTAQPTWRCRPKTRRPSFAGFGRPPPRMAGSSSSLGERTLHPSPLLLLLLLQLQLLVELA
jgi:hypothetical protein